MCVIAPDNYNLFAGFYVIATDKHLQPLSQQYQMESALEPPSMDLHMHTCCSSQFSNSLAVSLASQHPQPLGIPCTNLVLLAHSLLWQAPSHENKELTLPHSHRVCSWLGLRTRPQPKLTIHWFPCSHYHHSPISWLLSCTSVTNACGCTLAHTHFTITLAKQTTLAHPHLESAPKRANMHIHISISILILKVRNVIFASAVKRLQEHCTHPHLESPLPDLLACWEQNTIACSHPNPWKLKTWTPTHLESAPRC